MRVDDRTDDTMTELDELRVACAAHRQSHGLSLRTMAARVRCGETALYRFELGRTMLTAARRRAIRELVERGW